MMLKIIFYAYIKRIYSSRKIAAQLGENIYFMWLSVNQDPDFRTINRFRSSRMKNIIYETFFSIVDLLCQEGLVKLEDYYFNRTKIEANANKYTFVWKKSTEKFDKKLDGELDEWICANNRRLIFKYERKGKTENGYESVKRTYQCTDCSGCPFQSICTKDKDLKSISVSTENQKQRQEVRERLSTEEGKKKYKQRKIDVEPVFGQIKFNSQFQRFSLRGLSKNTVEWGLICVSNN